MTHDIELVRGKGNVFRDFGYADADAEHLKAVLAAQIIKVLDKQKLSVRTAGELTGIAAADFSRVRRAKLDRFTIDRLMTILGRLDQKVDVAVNVRPKTAQPRSSLRSQPAEP
jgi:predicted XRE-type DNA-binding protein